MPPFAKAPASPGGHYSAPHFILVLNITNKGGSCVIKQHRVCVEAAGKLKSEAAGGGVNPGNPTPPPPPTLMFILQLKARLADENTFSRGWYKLSCKQRNISMSAPPHVSLWPDLHGFKNHTWSYLLSGLRSSLSALSFFGCCYVSCQNVSWGLQLPRYNHSPSVLHRKKNKKNSQG